LEVLRNWQIVIPESEVLRYLGYKAKLNQLPTQLMTILDEELGNAEQYCNYQAIYRILPVQAQQGSQITLADGKAITSTKLSTFLACADYVAVLAATIGGRIEELVDTAFAKGEYTRAIVIDAIGSAAVEALADAVTARIAKEAAQKGYGITARYSPGYGDWSLAAQKDIINWLAADKILGITLTTAAMLVPQKTITAVIGLMKQAIKLPAKCQACIMDTCDFKNERDEN